MFFAVPRVRDFVTKWLSPWLWLSICAALVAVAFTEPPLGLTLMAFLMPWAIVGTIVRPESLPARLLEWSWLTWIGRLSYSLYLWQQVTISPLWARVGLVSPKSFWLWQVALSFSAAFGCAIGSYYLVERPLVRWGHRLAVRVKRQSCSGK